MHRSVSKSENFYTCISGRGKFKCEWPIQPHDMAAQSLQLMPTINWFSSEPDSSRLKHAIAELQDFCPILGSRVCYGNVESAAEEALDEHRIKYVLDTSLSMNQDASLSCGIAYAEILDLDDEAVENFLLAGGLHSKLDFANKLDEIFLQAVMEEVDRLACQGSSDKELVAYVQRLRDIKRFPRNGIVSIDNPLAPLWSVIKLGSKNKKYWAVLTICNHCLFDGYGMFAVQKQLAKSYAEPNYLEENFLRLVPSDKSVSLNSFSLGLQLEQAAMAHALDNKPLLFTTNFNAYLQRYEAWAAKSGNAAIGVNGENDPIDNALKVKAAVGGVLQAVQPMTVKEFWQAEAITWAKSLLTHYTEEELNAGVLALVRALVVGAGADGGQDEFGIRSLPECQAQVVKILFEERDIKTLVLEAFDIEREWERKPPKVDATPSLSEDAETVALLVMSDKEVAKIKRHYSDMNADNHQPNESLCLSTNDTMMQFLLPERMTAWAQIVGIRDFSAELRYGVASNVLGNALDFIGYAPGTEQHAMRQTHTEVDTAGQGQRKENDHFPLSRLPLTAVTLRRLLLRYRGKGGDKEVTWMEHNINPRVLLDRQNFDMLLNSWTKFSGEDWYPWEFGGNSQDHFLLQTHMAHLMNDWSTAPKGRAIDLAGVLPFRQILLHKCSSTHYHICMLGITQEDKRALSRRLSEIGEISSEEAEQRFY